MAAAGHRPITAALALVWELAAAAAPASAQTAHRDAISDLIAKNLKVAETAAAPPSAVAPQAQPPAPAPKDPREGEETYEQARALMQAIDAVLQDTAEQRTAAQKLPGRDEFILTPFWTETREDREQRVRNLLDSALGIVTDAPIVDMQKKVEGFRHNIRDIEDDIARLKEKQVTAPKDGMLPGMLTDTVDSLGNDIADAQKRIAKNKDEIAKTKGEITQALSKAGVELAPEQVDLLLDSVLSGDLVRLVAVFNAAKVDRRPARQAADGGRRQHELSAQILRDARSALRHAGARAGYDHRQDRHELHAQARRHPEGYRRGAGQDEQSAAGREPARPDARSAGQSRRAEGGGRSRQRLPPLPAGTARADRAGAHARRRTICASPTTPTRRSRRASSSRI